MESLEGSHEALAARARAAAQAEKKALADRAEFQALADGAESSVAARVREREEENARLRRQLEGGADAAQARDVQRRTQRYILSCGRGWWCVRVDAVLLLAHPLPRPLLAVLHGLLVV